MKSTVHVLLLLLSTGIFGWQALRILRLKRIDSWNQVGTVLLAGGTAAVLAVLALLGQVTP